MERLHAQDENGDVNQHVPFLGELDVVFFFHVRQRVDGFEIRASEGLNGWTVAVWVRAGTPSVFELRVQTKFGKIDCEYVVIATGMWSRQIGEDIGVSIPLYPNEHFYIITEPLDKLPKNLPVLRDYNSCLYLKEDAGKMLVGIFEPNAKPAFKDKGVVPQD